MTKEEVEDLMMKDDPRVFQIKEFLDKKLYVIDADKLSVEEMEERIVFANARIFEENVDSYSVSKTLFENQIVHKLSKAVYSVDLNLT